MRDKVKKDKLNAKELRELKKKIKEIDKKFNSIKVNENLKKEKKDFLKLKKKIESLEEPTIKVLKTFEKTLAQIKKSFNDIHKPLTERKQKNTKRGLIIFYLIFALTIVSFVFWGLSKSLPSIMDIFTKFFGSYQLSLLISWGFFYVLMGVILIEVVVWAGIIEYNKIKFPWVFATIVIMFCFFVISAIYTQISIGQEDLHLVLRNSSDTTKIIGDFDCSGGSKSFLLVGEKIICNINPTLINEEISVIFTFENKTKSESMILINNSFIAPQNITYILFNVNGLNEGEVFSANVGYPYKFLTEEEAHSKKKDFLKYLGVIFAIIFVTIPLMMNKFKELAKE
jgi:hypothetical protein